MKLLRKVGVTSEIWQIFIADSSSSTGAGLTGLAYNSASLTAYYHRDTDTTATAITLATMTVGTFTSSGFKEIDATNMPGWYQFCPPNAALASGAKSCAFHLKGATNMAPLPIEVDLQGDVNVTHAAGTAVTLDSNNVLNVSAKYWAGTAITATSIPVATAAGAAGGLFIAGSNAATTISGLTTGALSCTTITASGAVAFQSTFAVTTSTSLAALSCSTLTASGAVALQSTLGITGATTFTGNVAMAAGLNITQSSVNTSALVVTGNGTGHGAIITSGSGVTGNGVQIVSAATNGSGLNLVSTGTGSGLTTDEITNSGTTTLTGAVSLGSTLGVTGATTLAALTTTGTVTMNALTVSNATTLSGAVSLGSTLGVTGTTTFAAINTGAVGITTLATSGTTTLNALTVSGATTLTGAVTASNASNNIVGIDVAKLAGTAYASADFSTTMKTSITTACTAATPTVSVGSLGADAITAVSIAADAAAEIGTAVWASGTRTLTAGTNIQLPNNGLDLVLIESGISASSSLTNDAGTQLTSINARQGLALCTSVLAGVLAGAATTTNTMKAGGNASSNTRVTATVDSSGNRTALTIKVPT